MFMKTRAKILPLLERWQSGRLYLTRNQAYCKVPRVRIPPSPPEHLAKPVSDWAITPPSPALCGVFRLYLLTSHHPIL